MKKQNSSSVRNSKSNTVSSTEAVDVQTNVRLQPLFHLKMFKFKAKLPKHDVGVEYTILEYPECSPIPYEEDEFYVLAASFEEAFELIKCERSLARNLTLKHIESVEEVNNKVFIRTKSPSKVFYAP